MDAEFVVWMERVRGSEDGQLMAALQELVRRDRRCEVRIVMCLAEVDERRLYLAQGFSSLSRYAIAVLRMSEQRAYLRIQAARLVRRFPVVLDMLAEGALNLSTLKILHKHLSPDNHVALLERARNMTKDEVELLIAEIAPQDDVPTRIRKLPARAISTQARLDAGPTAVHTRALNDQLGQPRAAGAPAGSHGALFSVIHGDAEHASEVAAQPSDVANVAAVGSAAIGGAEIVAHSAVNHRVPTPFVLEAPRASCTPLRPGRFKLQLTASQALYDKLMQLQHLYRHQVPGGDLAVILERACDLLIEKKLKQRFAQVSKPRSSASKSTTVARVRGTDKNEEPSAGACKDVEQGAPAGCVDQRNMTNEPCTRMPATEDSRAAPIAPRRSKRSRYIPRAVLREVFARDGGQCTFLSPAGLRCSERGMLEVHHIHPFAFDGEPTVENLKLVCRAHNGFFADQDFGAAHMRMKRASTRTRTVQTALFA